MTGKGAGVELLSACFSIVWLAVNLSSSWRQQPPPKSITELWHCKHLLVQND